VGEIRDKLAQATEFKKTVAWRTFFFDNVTGDDDRPVCAFEMIIDSMNEYCVGCPCPNCLRAVNYKFLDSAREVREALTVGAVDAVENKDCWLYSMFKELCAEFKVPAPDDSVDHPAKKAGPLAFHSCLGVKPNGTADKGSWAERVMNLPYDTQTKTIYPMIHHMVMIFRPCQEEPRFYLSFEEWFATSSEISLLY
jgi:hypothetical protein